MRRTRALGWLAVLAPVVLTTRAVAYALAPVQDPTATRLAATLGGPRPLVVALVAMGLAALLSSLVVGLATIGATERWHALPDRAGVPRPRLAVRRLLWRAGALWIAGMAAFTVVENYIHWRAGLGVHGLYCLLGPVHRDAIPIAAAAALLAASLVTAGAHLLTWMRRRVAAALGPQPPAARTVLALCAPTPPRLAGRLDRPAPRPRGPPLAAV
jgi:hypothetical protein